LVRSVVSDAITSSGSGVSGYVGIARIMQPTWAPGASSRAALVARALATSSLCTAWYRSVLESWSLGVLMPPLISGACSTELISLKVSQYFTRAP